MKSSGGRIEKQDTCQIFGLQMVYLQSYDKKGTQWTAATAQVMEWIKDGHRKLGRLEINLALLMYVISHFVSAKLNLHVYSPQCLMFGQGGAEEC